MKINIAKIAALILVIIAWITGQITGMLAWITLLLSINIVFNYERHN